MAGSRVTVVLVHGASAGAWVWEPLTKELDARGIKHVEVDLPTMELNGDPGLSFHDDADHVRAVLDDINGPVVLVGNSYGGVVITEASAGHHDVVRLVYLAAFMPDADEEFMSLVAASCTPETMSGASATADGRADVDGEVLKKIALQQSPREVAEWAVSNKRPMSMGQAGSPSVAGVGWRSIPSTYIVCSEDRCIRPVAQRQWATERATNHIEVPFDHSPQLSHPAEVADILAGIVETSQATTRSR